MNPLSPRRTTLPRQPIANAQTRMPAPRDPIADAQSRINRRKTAQAAAAAVLEPQRAQRPTTDPAPLNPTGEIAAAMRAQQALIETLVQQNHTLVQQNQAILDQLVQLFTLQQPSDSEQGRASDEAANEVTAAALEVKTDEIEDPKV